MMKYSASVYRSSIYNKSEHSSEHRIDHWIQLSYN